MEYLSCVPFFHSWGLPVVGQVNIRQKLLVAFWSGTHNGRNPYIGSLVFFKEFSAASVLLDHLVELARVNACDFNSNRENSHSHNELVSRKSLPKRLGTMTGTLMFIWGWWILRCGRDHISNRTAILAIIGVIGGFILALWSI